MFFVGLSFRFSLGGRFPNVVALDAQNLREIFPSLPIKALRPPRRTFESHLPGALPQKGVCMGSLTGNHCAVQFLMRCRGLPLRPWGAQTSSWPWQWMRARSPPRIPSGQTGAKNRWEFRLVCFGLATHSPKSKEHPLSSPRAMFWRKARGHTPALK